MRKKALLEELIPPAAGVGLLSAMIGVDLSGYPLDGPLPELPNLDQINGGKKPFSAVERLS
ncbi:hypothetical protein GCM10020331_059360 [Ectobacillus funiculus]